MGAWGTGVKQSDEFMDYYEEFFDAYKDGKDPVELANEIWNKYAAEFRDDVPLDADTDIMHTLRFALVQCLWECGINEHPLFDEVDTIIKNDLNLKFWGPENGGNDKLSESRRKALLEFLDKLHSEPSRIKAAKKSRKPRTPSFKKGDIFAYRDEDKGFRVAIILDYIEKDCLIAVSDSIYSRIPSAAEFMEAQTSIVFWIWEKDVLPKKMRVLLDNVKISDSYNGYAGYLRLENGSAQTSWPGDKEYFFGHDSIFSRLRANRIGTYTVKDLLVPDLLPKTAWNES